MSNHITIPVRACCAWRNGALAGFLVALADLTAEPTFEQVRTFIDLRPTIENFEFRLTTERLRDSRVPDGKTRSFQLIHGAHDLWRLVEDVRDMPMRPLQLFANPSERLVFRGEPIRPIQLDYRCWMRYRDEVWSTYDDYGASIVASATEAAWDRRGPAEVARHRLGFGLEALNYGLSGVGTNKLAWNGARFVCPANDHGFRLEGEVMLDPAGTPQKTVYDILSPEGSYRYEANYKFTPSNPALPEFFPSQIQVWFISDGSRRLVTNFEIQALKCSERHLSKQDIAYQPFEQTDVTHFGYKGNETYMIEPLGGTNFWKRFLVVEP